MKIEAIRVCPLEGLDEQVAAFEATHLLSLLGPNYYFARPERIDETSHLLLRFKDTDRIDDSSGPQLQQVRMINAWFDGLPSDSRLLIHCVAGMSRSPAAALGVYAQGMSASDAVAALYSLCPYATPNGLMVQHWDKILGFRGKLVTAVEEFQKLR